MLTIKTCKWRGAIVPLGGDDDPKKWAAFPLPAREGKLTGRVLTTAAVAASGAKVPAWMKKPAAK